MSHNTFGNLLKFTTWGESHGKAIGCVVDGFPANIPIDLSYIQSKLDLRKPGQSKFTTQRKEKDFRTTVKVRTASKLVDFKRMSC